MKGEVRGVNLRNILFAVQNVWDKITKIGNDKKKALVKKLRPVRLVMNEFLMINLSKVIHF